MLNKIRKINFDHKINGQINIGKMLYEPQK